MIVIWVGTVAATNMPTPETLSPTQTAIAQAVIMADEDPPQQPVSCSLSGKFPDDILQWCTLIENSAAETGVPASLIASVMLQESGGDPHSYSSSGAVGLMQVMPRDGIASEFMCVNGPCFASRPTIKELEDPGFNIAYGSQMLADLYTKLGDYREVLFRYGPMDMGYHYADLVLSIWDNYQ
jgi:soluble lytic murein transglycosylase-like protein